MCRTRGQCRGEERQQLQEKPTSQQLVRKARQVNNNSDFNAAAVTESERCNTSRLASTAMRIGSPRPPSSYSIIFTIIPPTTPNATIRNSEKAAKKPARGFNGDANQCSKTFPRGESSNVVGCSACANNNLLFTPDVVQPTGP